MTRSALTVAPGLLLVALAALPLAGCAAASTPAAASAPAPAVTPATTLPSASALPPASATAVRTVTVTVTGTTVSPAPATVALAANEPVRLVVTSDVANQLHLHGLDIEKDLPAGMPVTVEVRYPDPGTYEVETHQPSLLLLRFAVR